MKDDYGEMGRLFASVDMERRFLEEPGLVDLVMHINEDTPYRIRRIEPIIGGDHPHTNETVILNALPFAPGDLANSKKSNWDESGLPVEGILPTARTVRTPPKMDIRKVEDNPEDDGTGPRKSQVIHTSSTSLPEQSTIRAQAYSGSARREKRPIKQKLLPQLLVLSRAREPGRWANPVCRRTIRRSKRRAGRKSDCGLGQNGQCLPRSDAER